MESQQSVMPQTPSIVGQSPKSGSTSEVENSSNSTWDFGVHKNHQTVSLSENSKEVIGVVEVFIHQARDIHNICIYHKQDVYAKLCLTCDPDTSASTQIVNGGGRNPVFNENLSLNVRTVDSSVKCEIWMLSRVRNYMEDQMLGFALVPLSDVLSANGGKLSQEFTLSSTDLFHSPAGFVELSLAYIGASPDVLEVSAPQLSSTVHVNDAAALGSPNEELEKLEFPDPKVLNENHLMVSEYFELSCSDLQVENFLEMEIGSKGDLLKSIDSPSLELVDNSIEEKNVAEKPAETITSSVSTNGSPTQSTLESANSQPVNDNIKLLNGTSNAAGDSETISSIIPTQDFAKLAVSVPVEPDQQDYVDMYLKSMQQFTDSLAKMKLPVNIDNNIPATTTPDSNSNSTASNGKGSKVFYGSRAFF